MMLKLKSKCVETRNEFNVEITTVKGRIGYAQPLLVKYEQGLFSKKYVKAAFIRVDKKFGTFRAHIVMKATYFETYFC